MRTNRRFVLGCSRAGQRTKAPRVEFWSGGLASRPDADWQWLQRELQRGDEVRIRIIEAAKVEKPKTRRRQRATPAQVKSRKQAFARRLVKELGWKIQTK